MTEESERTPLKPPTLGGGHHMQFIVYHEISFNQNTSSFPPFLKSYTK